MLLLLQNVLYCLLYVMLIKCAVKNDGLNCLYFYPKEYIEEAEKRGIANKETVMKKSKWFMIPFCVIIFVALILIISIWNHVTDFKTAYFQSFLFLVIMNWFDVSYVKSWKTVLIKRGAATVVYMLVALVVAGIVVLISKI